MTFVGFWQNGSWNHSSCYCTLTFLLALILSACCWVYIVLLSVLMSPSLSPPVFLHGSICDCGSIALSRAAYVVVSVAPSAPSPSPHVALPRRPGQRAALAPAQQGATRTAPQRLHELQTQDAVPEKPQAWGKDLRDKYCHKFIKKSVITHYKICRHRPTQLYLCSFVSLLYLASQSYLQHDA